MASNSPLWADKVPADLWRHPMVSATPRPGMGRKLAGGGYGHDEGESVAFEISELMVMPTLAEQQALALGKIKIKQIKRLTPFVGNAIKGAERNTDRETSK